MKGTLIETIEAALHEGVCPSEGDICCWSEETERCENVSLMPLADKVSDRVIEFFEAVEVPS